MMAIIERSTEIYFGLVIFKIGNAELWDGNGEWERGIGMGKE
jgi:hypothetical protein